MRRIGFWILALGGLLTLAVGAMVYGPVQERHWSSNARNGGLQQLQTGGYRTIPFTGLGPEDSLGRADLGNPERGFRTEILLDAADLSPAFHDDGQTHGADNFGQTLRGHGQNHQYRSDSFTLTQLYFYLDSTWLGQPIPEKYLQNIAAVLASLPPSGYKAILRFAYQKQALRTADCSPRNSVSAVAPRVQVKHIQQHTRQLAPLLKKHYPVVQAVQAGFVGAWGEWHNDFYGHPCFPDSVRAILQAVLEATPGQRQVMVREPTLKRTAGLLENKRIGYHNDYFVLDQGKHRTSDYSKARRGVSRKSRRHFERVDFRQVRQEGFATYVDGEMPYDAAGDEWSLTQPLPGDYAIAQRMRAHGYTSFSVVHNYGTNIKAWKDKQITARQLREDRAPVTPGYFQGGGGKEVPRSLYEYLRDHLGYRLQLTSATVPRFLEPDQHYTLQAQLINTGFAAPVNPRPAYLVLINPQGNVTEYPTDAQVRSWLPQNKGKAKSYPLSATISLPDNASAGLYQLGVWLPDGSEELRYHPAFAIRLPNKGVYVWQDPARRYLVNVFAEILLQ